MKKNPLFRLLLVILLAVLSANCGGGSGSGPGGDNPGGGPGGGNGGDPPDGNDDDGDDDGDAVLPGTDGSKGLIFVAQTPNPAGTSDIGTHTATFGNGKPSIASAPRGGSLMFLRADGKLVDLLDAALKNGCDAGGDAICDKDGVLAVNDGGLLVDGYVVRRPRVHWDADKVMFAMTRGAKEEQFGQVKPEAPKWQLYEIAGLDAEDKPVMTKVKHQPDFNNVDAIYGSDGRIFFISDKTVTGNPNHYPQLDEYESEEINTGLWRLDTKTGHVMLMDHSPSGDFGPEITPSGHVIFTRWDHLQQDQQSIDNSVTAVVTDKEDHWKAYTYESEDQAVLAGDAYTLVSDFTRNRLQAWVDGGKADTGLLHEAATGMEMFPETVRGNPFYEWDDDKPVAPSFTDTGGTEHAIAFTQPSTGFGRYNPLRFNHFLPWQITQDGLQCETYRHTGLQETGGFIEKSLRDDPKLATIETTKVRIPDGFFLNQVFDDEKTGFEVVTGVVSPEFGTHKAGSLLQFIDTQVASKPVLHENGDAVEFKALTDPEDDRHLYRDPVFLSDGTLIAAVSRRPETGDRTFGAFDFTLYLLKKDADTGFYEPSEPLLEKGIVREFDYWEENGGIDLHRFSGRLWEIEAQEVIARTEPAIPAEPLLEDPELDAFSAAGVDPDDFRKYLRDNNLAVIVIRNATSRDEADSTQPFNLVVKTPDGSEHERSVHTDFQAGDLVYPITYLQLMRADYLRGYEKFRTLDEDGNVVSEGGRRVLPNPLEMTAELAHNLDVAAAAPKGAVPIQTDGSIAALVPAHRAMTWQTTDIDGDPVVRERYWLTFQPGEVRVCASCHGVNDRAQDGSGKPANKPLALQNLLEALKDAGEFNGL
ncbi:MAG TPA: hypothetical protein VF267_03820 [Gammaproteobacteria bacterium]